MRKVNKNNFWDRGITDRSFIMLASVITFFLFASVGMIASFFIEINEVFLEILKMTSPVLMTITAATFSIDGVEKFTDRKTKQEIESIVDKQVDNAEIGKDISESIYTNITLEGIEEIKNENEYPDNFFPEKEEEDNRDEYLV